MPFRWRFHDGNISDFYCSVRIGIVIIACIGSVADAIVIATGIIFSAAGTVLHKQFKLKGSRVCDIRNHAV